MYTLSTSDNANVWNRQRYISGDVRTMVQIHVFFQPLIFIFNGNRSPILSPSIKPNTSFIFILLIFIFILKLLYVFFFFYHDGESNDI